MAKNVSLWGTDYTAVPALDVPQTGGGTARFIDPSPTTAVDSDVLSGKIYFKADGTQSTGTGSGGGGSVTQDANGFIVLPPTGGGGGGGDYSTAEVTIVSRHGIDTYFPRPIEANTWYQGQPPLIECIAQGLFSGVYTVVLYKGGLYTSLTSDYSFGVSGNITEINSGEYLITGDCTITET